MKWCAKRGENMPQNHGSGFDAGLRSSLCFYMQELDIENEKITSESMVFKITGM